MISVSASARVQITVEVVESSWGKECSIGQVYEQASRMAVSRVAGMVAKGGGKIIGEPRVVGMLTEST